MRRWRALVALAAIMGAGAAEAGSAMDAAIERAPYRLRLKTVAIADEPAPGSTSMCRVHAEVVSVARAPADAGTWIGRHVRATVPCRSDAPGGIRYGAAVSIADIRPGRVYDVAIMRLSYGELRMLHASLRPVVGSP